jgi:hypothetical protein
MYIVSSFALMMLALQDTLHLFVDVLNLLDQDGGSILFFSNLLESMVLGVNSPC